MVEEARAALAKTSGVEQEDDEVLTVEQELEKRKNAADSNGKNLSGCLGLGVVLESGFLFFEFFFEKDDSFRSCFCDVFIPFAIGAWNTLFETTVFFCDVIVCNVSAVRATFASNARVGNDFVRV